MIGHADGEINLITLDALKVELSYKFDLDEDEELSVGTFSPFGLNFAVGTSFGAVYFGQFKKDIQSRSMIVRVARLKGLAKSI